MVDEKHTHSLNINSSYSYIQTLHAWFEKTVKQFFLHVIREYYRYMAYVILEIWIDRKFGSRNHFSVNPEVVFVFVFRHGQDI